MLARVSWPSFAVRTGRYGRWVDKARQRLTHGVFAEYLADCIVLSPATIFYGLATALTPAGSQWQVEYSDAVTGTAKALSDLDGVVVASPRAGPVEGRLHRA